MEEEVQPLQNQSLHQRYENSTRTSDTRIFLNMVKSMIGSGILAAPYMANRAGIAIAMPAIALLCMINSYQMKSLIFCYSHVCKKLGFSHLELGDLVYFSFQNSKSPLKSCGGFARFMTNCIIFLFQIGSNSVYIIFIGSTISQIINQFHPNDLPLNVYFISVTCFLMIFIFVHKLEFLSYFSLFANICALIGIIFVFYFSSVGISEFATFKLVGDFRGFAIFIGAAVYSIEGITLVLPLYSDMDRKHYFMGLYNLCISLQLILTWGLQILGTIKFGDQLCGLIALNLPLTDTLSLSTRAMFMCSVFVSYGLQFYILIRLVIVELYRSPFWMRVITRVGAYKFETLVRLLAMLIALGTSIGIPYLSMMMSVFGAFCGISLGLILPAIIELMTFHGEYEHFGIFRWKAVLNYVVIIGGSVVTVMVFYASALELFEAFHGHPPTPDSCRG